MVKCKNCEAQWPANAVLKRYITLDVGMDCPHCGKIQYLSQEYRKRSILATLLIPLLILLPAFFNVSFIAIALTFVAAFIAITCIHLFTIELAGEEETWGNGYNG
ncbi:TIGR04104 family putative zinc finger protein [Salinicoccus sp. HZC-1]|uniref:TIGR04104 family putative zinc finger protein n=1 Tax=Salinicoccus sp. HZC-1 TaxID=3385497 RepID=UPI00398A5638